MLMEIVNENDMIVVNSADICTGVITRIRETTIRTEKSVLDFFIVCKKFFTYITKMTVDEARKYPLTKFSSKVGNKSIKMSDHNTLILDLSIRWNSNNEISNRQEIFNFKNEEQFNRFEMLTESDKDLKNCFEDCSDVNKSANKWLKIVNNLIKKSFKKIRIKQQKMNPKLENLFATKESIKSKIEVLENSENNEDLLDDLFELEEEYDETIEKIGNLCATKNKELVNQYLGKSQDTIEGHNQERTWALRKKLCPKTSVEPPSAKMDADGNLVTNKTELENLYLNTYVQRLTPNPVKEGLEDIIKLKEMMSSKPSFTRLGVSL